MNVNCLEHKNIFDLKQTLTISSLLMKDFIMLITYHVSNTSYIYGEIKIWSDPYKNYIKKKIIIFADENLQEMNF